MYGGAPTAVLNASLYGVIDEAKALDSNLQVLGARFGTGGLLIEDFVDLSSLDINQLPRMTTTPGSLIGTSRTPLKKEDYKQLAAILRRIGAEYVLFNGGNGTMETCGKMCETDPKLKVIGIPKTIDNDIAVTDHSPGYGSAARYIAMTVRDIVHDVRSMPIHICIVEVMGRNAGWLTAAAALAEQEGFGADLIYPPEEPFIEDAFLEDVMRLHRYQGCATIVVSEGIKNEANQYITTPLMTNDRAVYYGDVGTHLANLIVKRLGIKARSEKPGIACRASAYCQSESDRKEAEACGREALRLALSGKTGRMVTIKRDEGKEYHAVYSSTDISNVMLHESTLPDKYFNKTGNHISDNFKTWCLPLTGNLPDLFFDRRMIK